MQSVINSILAGAALGAAAAILCSLLVLIIDSRDSRDWTAFWKEALFFGVVGGLLGGAVATILPLPGAFAAGMVGYSIASLFEGFYRR